MYVQAIKSDKSLGKITVKEHMGSMPLSNQCDTAGGPKCNADKG